jgi:hypothetical protein
MMDFRIRLQLVEAFSPVNRWYCSQYYRRQIDDEETLLRYYIKSGGARDFAERFNEATSGLNRWYASQYHQHDVRDPLLLWEYYMKHRSDRARGKKPKKADDAWPTDHSGASECSEDPSLQHQGSH